MSTPQPPGPATTTSPPRPPAGGGGPPGRREIKLVSHSTIFYWWPIWLLGYVFALITYFDDSRFAIVPPGSKLYEVASTNPKQAKYELVVPLRTEGSKDA